MKKNLPLIFLLVCFFTGYTQSNNTFLWKIENTGNGKPSYLFGTIHIPQEKFMQLPDSVYYCIGAADAFYAEIDFDNLMAELSNDDDGFYQSILDYLDSVKETTAWKSFINKINSFYNTSINPDSIEQFTTFSSSLMEDLTKPDPGVTAMDMALTDYAKRLNKKNGGLETYKLQIGMMYDIIDMRLKDTSMLFNNEIMLAENLKKYYTESMYDSLAALINALAKNYREIVFDNRNMNMATAIKNISNKGTAFFAVGSGHLVGDKGLITLLRQKGLRLSPVFSANKISLTAVTNLSKGFKNTVIKEIKNMPKPALNKTGN